MTTEETDARHQSPQFFYDQAPLILRSRDSNNDGKISQSEAVDGMKTNFSFIDSNGDGGIDLDELRTVLQRVAAQRGR